MRCSYSSSGIFPWMDQVIEYSKDTQCLKSIRVLDIRTLERLTCPVCILPIAIPGRFHAITPALLKFTLIVRGAAHNETARRLTN